MRPETIAIHGGYDVDPTTKAVAVPIYQTVSYAFDSADHAAALFNLEAEGYRYTRIGNPTTAVLERRVAELEGGLEALCVASGQAAVNYAILNVASLGTNIVSPPQLYGTTHTLFAYVLPSQGIGVRFAENDRPEAIERLIDDQTRAVFCESVGNPAGNICDIEELARIAHKHGIPLIVDNTVATPILLKPIDWGADIVVQSLTKFMGGHGTTLGGAIVDSGNFPWKENVDPFPDVLRAGPLLSWPDLCRSFRPDRLHCALPQRIPANDRCSPVSAKRFPAAAGNRNRRAASRAPCRERQRGRGLPQKTSQR